MKTITLDVINRTAVSETAEGDVGVKLVVTNAPDEWGNCSVFALFTQGEQTRHELIKNPDGEYNIATVPSEFTDTNKAFKIGVYAIGADASRDVRLSVWIRVMDTDFTTEDIIVTQQTLDDVLDIQALYTKYVKSEAERVANEEIRVENEEIRIANEEQRGQDYTQIKEDISNLKKLAIEFVDAIPPDGGNVYPESGYKMYVDKNTIMIVYVSGSNVTQYIIKDGKVTKYTFAKDSQSKNVQNIYYTDSEYKPKSLMPQSGKAVAQAIAQLVGSAPDTLNTLEELADALKDNADIVDVLNEAIGQKVDKVEGYGLSYASVFDDKILIGFHDTNGLGNHAYLFYDALAIDEFLLGKADKAELNDMLIYKVNTSDFESFKNELLTGEFGVHNAEYATNANYAEEAGYAQTAYDSDRAGCASADHNGDIIHLTYATKEELRPTPLTSITGTLSPNQPYHLSEPPSSIVFPSVDVSDGDTIYITFMTGDTPPTISIDMKNTTDIDIVIEADTGYEIYGKYVANINKWIVGYSSYKVPGGDEA